MADSDPPFSLRILTINTHKGFTAFNRRFILPDLREAVRRVDADIVCLQEVLGEHELHALRVEGWPQTTHYEFLADTVWEAFAYGRNAVYPEGHHGNAILSRHPIARFENLDISIPGHENRGLLHCEVMPGQARVHIICVHLGLYEQHRQTQLIRLAEHVNRLPAGEAVIVAGDFNDWRQRANAPLYERAGLEEVFTRMHGKPVRTFPAPFPLLRLDRIYVKNAVASHPEMLALHDWRHLSDHAPLAVEVHL